VQHGQQTSKKFLTFFGRIVEEMNKKANENKVPLPYFFRSLRIGKL
jgi:hypothetical protein